MNVSSGWFGRAWPGAVGLGLGLLALGPGLRRGFLLSYDMLFVPREPFAAAVGGQAPPRAVPSDLVIAALSRAVPADLVQKAILLSVFVLACSGAARLLDREPWPAGLAAGVYYAWNPYVGERLIIGQWALLLGYAGLPWVLRPRLDQAWPPGAARPGWPWPWCPRSSAGSRPWPSPRWSSGRPAGAARDVRGRRAGAPEPSGPR